MAYLDDGTVNGGIFLSSLSVFRFSALMGSITGGIFEEDVSVDKTSITGGIFLGSVSQDGSTLSTLPGTAKFGTAYNLKLESNSRKNVTTGNYINHTNTDLRYYQSRLSKGVVYKDGTANRYQYIPDSSRELVGLYLLASDATKPTKGFEITSVFDKKELFDATYYEFTMPAYDCVVYAVYATPDAETPSMNVQPKDGSYCVGDMASALSVAAKVSDGGTLSYQWYSSTSSNTTGGTAIDGATSASYTPSTNAVGTTYYYCVVTNTLSDVAGNTSATATSNAAKVEVAEHAWGAVPSWNWTVLGNAAAAEATFTCTKNSSHTQVVAATVSSPVVIDATCTKDGSTTHTANVDFEGATYSDTYTETISALGHELGELIPEVPATYDATGMRAHYVCKRCGMYLDADKNETTVEALAIAKLTRGRDGADDTLAATGDLLGFAIPAVVLMAVVSAATAVATRKRQS